MKDGFFANRKVKLSIYFLPKTIYVRFSALLWFLIVLINGLTIWLTLLLRNGRNIIFEDPVSVVAILPFIILTVYMDIDVVHSIMKKQFIEVSNKFIRVKKLFSDKTFNWSEIAAIEEMYSVKLHMLNGVKLKKRDNDKTSLIKRKITINFNKFANIEVEELFEIIYRKKRNI